MVTLQPSLPRKPIAGPSAYLTPESDHADVDAHASHDSGDGDAAQQQDEWHDGMDEGLSVEAEQGRTRHRPAVLAPAPPKPKQPEGGCAVVTMLLVCLCVLNTADDVQRQHPLNFRTLAD